MPAPHHHPPGPEPRSYRAAERAARRLADTALLLGIFGGFAALAAAAAAVLVPGAGWAFPGALGAGAALALLVCAADAACQLALVVVDLARQARALRARPPL